MGNKVYIDIINRKIENFIKVFSEDSESIYKNDDGKLYHPGEFGMFRERVIKNLIETILPQKFGVSDGFIITGKNNRSTQCDLIIYDKDKAPLINDGIANFYPVESVVAIIEVKSIIRSEKELKDILKKLSKNKELDKDISSNIDNEENQISTFLICKKFDFSISNFKQSYFVNLYEGIEKKYWHNMILRVEDGLIVYNIIHQFLKKSNQEKFEQIHGNKKSFLNLYPIIERLKPLKDEQLFFNEIKSDEQNYHIKTFLGGLFTIFKNSKRPHLELQEYYLEQKEFVWTH